MSHVCFNVHPKDHQSTMIIIYLPHKFNASTTLECHKASKLVSLEIHY